MPSSITHNTRTDPSVPSSLLGKKQCRQDSVPQCPPAKDRILHPCPARGCCNQTLSHCHHLGMVPKGSSAARGSVDSVTHEIPLAQGEAQVEPLVTVFKMEIKEQRQSILKGLSFAAALTRAPGNMEDTNRPFVRTPCLWAKFL